MFAHFELQKRLMGNPYDKQTTVPATDPEGGKVTYISCFLPPYGNHGSDAVFRLSLLNFISTLPVLMLSPRFRSTIETVSPFSRETLASEGKQGTHLQQARSPSQFLGPQRVSHTSQLTGWRHSQYGASSSLHPYLHDRLPTFWI